MQNLVTQLFSVDHDRLDFLFQMYQKTRRSDPQAASRFFNKFTAGLRQHIEWEETLLFPAFDNAMGTQGFGPTAVMKSEHEQIKTLLDQIATHLATDSPADAAELALLDLLEVHNAKEENILYVECDSVLSEEQIAEILLKL